MSPIPLLAPEYYTPCQPPNAALTPLHCLTAPMSLTAPTPLTPLHPYTPSSPNVS